MSDSEFSGYSSRSDVKAERAADGDFRHDAEDRGEDGIVEVHICPGCGDEFPADILDEAAFCANCHDYTDDDAPCQDCGEPEYKGFLSSEGLCRDCDIDTDHEEFEDD